MRLVLHVNGVLGQSSLTPSILALRLFGSLPAGATSEPGGKGFEYSRRSDRLVSDATIREQTPVLCMPVECAKCGYVRKATDTNPEWQCPSCGIAYKKFLGATLEGQSKDDSKITLKKEPTNRVYRKRNLCLAILICSALVAILVYKDRLSTDLGHEVADEAQVSNDHDSVASPFPGSNTRTAISVPNFGFFENGLIQSVYEKCQSSLTRKEAEKKASGIFVLHDSLACKWLYVFGYGDPDKLLLSSGLAMKFFYPNYFYGGIEVPGYTFFYFHNDHSIYSIEIPLDEVTLQQLIDIQLAMIEKYGRDFRTAQSWREFSGGPEISGRVIAWRDTNGNELLFAVPDGNSGGNAAKAKVYIHSSEAVKAYWELWKSEPTVVKVEPASWRLALIRRHESHIEKIKNQL